MRIALLLLAGTVSLANAQSIRSEPTIGLARRDDACSQAGIDKIKDRLN